MVDVLAVVWAGAVHILYGFLDWSFRQLFFDTADRDVLVSKAAMYGITPTPATFATGNITATGTDATSIPTGTILRLDSVTSYRVTTGQVISSGTATLPVQAVLAGSAANAIVGTAVSFETPIAGVNSAATVATGGITGGNDEEDTEALRDRMLLRLQEPPGAGTESDYRSWALAVAGVTRVWVFGNSSGLGTVNVFFVRDGDASIFPDSQEVIAVQTAIDAERPITAQVIVNAPTELAIAFTIHLVPDNADTRAAVIAELNELMLRAAEPNDGIAGSTKGKIYLSQLRTAIGLATGVTDYTMTVPSADVQPIFGQLTTVGVITWT